MATKIVSDGVNGVTLLGIVFVVLKLTGFITWNWWLVTLPFWGGAVLLTTFAILTIIVMGIQDLVKKNDDD